eukprot:GHVS01065137.1.p1 GENE.GHVS01065137.1~~GHVS01065137.1.p1  ORF type:complete len:633 (+),score=111.41 GHVS01065137.1:353-2251(+)
MNNNRSSQTTQEEQQKRRSSSYQTDIEIMSAHNFSIRTYYENTTRKWHHNILHLLVVSFCLFFCLPFCGVHGGPPPPYPSLPLQPSNGLSSPLSSLHNLFFPSLFAIPPPPFPSPYRPSNQQPVHWVLYCIGFPIVPGSSDVRHIQAKLTAGVPNIQFFKVNYPKYVAGRGIDIAANYSVVFIEKYLMSMFRPTDKISFIGHSLGGLVARDVICQLKTKYQTAWDFLVKANFISLGVPHSGQSAAEHDMMYIFAGTPIYHAMGTERYAKQISTGDSYLPSLAEPDKVDVMKEFANVALYGVPGSLDDKHGERQTTDSTTSDVVPQLRWMLRKDWMANVRNELMLPKNFQMADAKWDGEGLPPQDEYNLVVRELLWPLATTTDNQTSRRVLQEEQTKQQSTIKIIDSNKDNVTGGGHDNINNNAVSTTTSDSSTVAVSSIVSPGELIGGYGMIDSMLAGGEPNSSSSPTGGRSSPTSRSSYPVTSSNIFAGSVGPCSTEALIEEFQSASFLFTNWLLTYSLSRDILSIVNYEPIARARSVAYYDTLDKISEQTQTPNIHRYALFVPDWVYKLPKTDVLDLVGIFYGRGHMAVAAMTAEEAAARTLWCGGLLVGPDVLRLVDPVATHLMNHFVI